MSEVIPLIDASKTIAVDFTQVGNQKWEYLNLSDGTKMKCSLFVFNVRRSIENQSSGEPAYMFNQNVVMTILDVPPELKREPAKVPIPFEKVNDPSNIDEIVDFEGKSAIGDEWSVYNLSDGTVLRVRLMITRFVRT